MGRGAFPDSHPLAMGMPGMHGTYTSITAIQKADLLISIGVRFDDRVTGNPKFFAPHAKVIHVDVDPAEIGKVRAADVPIVGDARRVMEQMIEAWGERDVPDRISLARHDPALAAGVSAPLRPGRRRADQTPVRGRRALPVDRRRRHRGGGRRPAPDVDQPVLEVRPAPRDGSTPEGWGRWALRFRPRSGPRPACPTTSIFAIDGDGCFQMTFNELITAAVEKIPVKIAVFNNGVHGMVTQWQRLFYGGRFSGTILGDVIDYPKLAEAMGCAGFRAETPDEVGPTLEKALAIDDRPVVVEMVVDREEMVFPMVPAGGSNDEVILGPSERVISPASDLP